MAPPPTQKNRRLGFATKEGDDALVVTRVEAHEELGRPFRIEVDLLGTDPSVNFNSWVGNNGTVWVERPDGGKRYFNGIISRFAQLPQEGRFTRYRATLVPWIWLLTRSADCRIFQNKSTADIIREVFKTYGFDDDYNLGSFTGRTREYCVQYRESDFNFVSRLLEQEGVYYYFKHEDEKHTLVLASDPSDHSPYESYDTIHYRPRARAGEESGENVTDWVAEMEVQTGAYVHGEFDYTMPSAPITSNDSVSQQHPYSSFEVFDYPGEFAARAEGDQTAKYRIQELQVQHEVAHGEATSEGIVTGYKFDLDNHPRSDQNRGYLVTGTTIQINSGNFESGGASKPQEFFTCKFTAIPASTQFRAARLARKPRIRGPQTAFVVGDSGAEVTTDSYGRVKVQFHWDREGKSDQNSSCWIRVSQPWAGGGWGGIVLPRIKQEVVVEFLEGDPDRPLITGCVYNATAPVPYALPDNKTISTFKSNSSTGGNGYNEFRFEDKAGSEKIYLHGQNDHDVRIGNDTKEWVGNDRHLIVKNDQLEKVENDHHLTVKNDRLEKVENDQHLTVEGERRLKVEGKFGEKLEDDHDVSVGGNDNLSVEGNQVIKVTGDVNLKGQNLNTQGTAKISVQSGDDFNVKSAANYNLESTAALHIKAGTTLVIEAGTQLSLKVGSSFIDIGSSGVSITGTMVNINSGGSPASGAACSPTSPTSPDSPDDPKDPEDPKEAAAS